MKHMNDRKGKFNSMINFIAVALVFAMLGVGMGVTATQTSALAEGDAAKATINYDHVSPAIAVYEECSESVVGVITYIEGWSRTAGDIVKQKAGEGSGVVISDEGHILTNNHVVENGNYYEVLLSSGEKVTANLVGTDSGTDVAVLQVEGQSLKPVQIGSSSALRVGETVIAIGNPGGSVLANSVTQGIVSALERDMSKAFTRTVRTIQHDAAINPGNSGGALLNVYGQLVGINTLKYTGKAYSSTSYEGLGFAIPIDMVMPLVEQIIQYGEVRRPAMGIMCGTFSGPEEPISNWPAASVLISEITEGGPAAEAGLNPYDFIVSIDGERVTTLNDLTAILDSHAEGDTVKVTVLRYDNINDIIALLNSISAESYGGSIFGGSIFGSGYNYNTKLTYSELTFDVTLRILEDHNTDNPNG